MMPLFLAPLLLGGLGLAVVPWLIHRIRRPERRPVDFGSLMFVPKEAPMKVERRRLQHVVLMLLRMAVLALLAAAFARPFLQTGVMAPPADATASSHLILIDRSLSMGVGGRMEAARARGLEVLQGLPESGDVGLMTFPEAAASAPGANGGEPGRAPTRRDLAREIEGLEACAGAADLYEALRGAHGRLETMRGGKGPGVIHLISDLQAPDPGEGASSSWRLPGETQLRVYDVGGSDPANRGVREVAVRRLRGGGMRIAARIRNDSMEAEAPFTVRLFLDGRLEEERTVEVLRHHASQVVFVRPGAERAFAGWIEIEPDGQPADDRRYFAWAPPLPTRVWLVDAGGADETWTSGAFTRAVMEGAGASPFVLEAYGPEEAGLRLAGGGETPEVVMVGELNGTEQVLTDPLLDWVEAGGTAMVTLDDQAGAEALTRSLLSRVGLHAGGSVEEPAGRPALIGEIDYDHPVFREFRDARYNDFSNVRAARYQRLRVEGEGERLSVLARLEGSGAGVAGDPALVEIDHGEGRILLWAFPFDPRATNFPRTSRFAPIVLESVRYLAGEAESLLSLETGTPAPIRDGAQAWVVQDASGKTERIGAGRKRETAGWIDQPGVLRTEGVDGVLSGVRGVVNPPARELEGERVSAEALLAAVASPRSKTVALEPGGRLYQASPLRQELGLWVLAAVLLLLGLEGWYAPRLVR